MRQTPDLWDAFADLIEAGPPPPLDDSGNPILDQVDAQGNRWPRYYRGQTEENPAGDTPPPGYFLFGIEPEDDVAMYNGEAGQDGFYRIHCWGTRPDDARALYRWLKGVLHNATITLPGYDPFTGSLSKSGPVPDIAGGAWQIEATYTAEPMEAAA